MFSTKPTMLSLFSGLIVSVIGTWYGLQPQTVLAQVTETSAQSVQWRTGSDLNRYIRNNFQATLYDAELGPRLRAFAQQQRVAVFLDRRIDPSMNLSLGLRNGSLEKFYWQIAKTLDVGICRVSDIHYFGPKTVTENLPLAWQQLKKKRPKSDIGWGETAPLMTETICAPKDILRQLAVKNQFKIENIDTIPHDVWAQLELPATSLEGRVGLLLAGFGKWYERSNDGTSIRIVDFPKFEKGELVFNDIPAAKELRKKLKAQFKDVRISARDSAITVNGTPKQLALLKSAMVDMQIKAVLPSQIRTYSMNTSAARGSILASIAQMTGRKFLYDRPAPAELREQLDFKHESMSVEQLIDEAVKGTELKTEITDEQLKVFK